MQVMLGRIFLILFMLALINPSLSPAATEQHNPLPPATTLPIIVTSPKAGDAWELGSTQTIKWTYQSNPPGADVVIKLSGTGIDLTISPKTPIGSGGNGSYTWKVPSMNVGNDFSLTVYCQDYRFAGQTKGFFTIKMPSAKISVTSPKGGEVFEPGTTQTVKWMYTGDIGPEVAIRVRALTPDGRFADRITYGIKVMPGGSGTWNWILPAKGEALSGNYQIILFSVTNPDIAGTSQIVHIKGPYMTIEESIAPPITFTSPKAGETWTVGTTQAIKWSYKRNPPGPDAKIFLLYEKSIVDRITLKTSIGSSGQGSYNWKVPDLPAASTYTLLIANTGDESFRGESSTFSITKPKATIAITSPKAGDTWKEGSTRTISWTCNNASVFAVNIGLLYGGSAVAIIAKDLKVMSGGSGAYNWVIPRLPSPSGGDYSIKIVAIPYAGGPIEAKSASFIIAK